MMIQKESLEKIISNKQIKPVFQPIISLKDGSVYGYEALSRTTGDNQIADMEELFTSAKTHNKNWELEALCREKTMENAYPFMNLSSQIKLFINVCPGVISQEALKKEINQENLSHYGIESHQLILEITERCVIEDLNSFENKILYYRDKGFQLALDDIGSAFSGLTRIKDLQPDFVKVDRGLIQNIHKEDIKKALLKGMVAFSKASHTKIIAEGIESYEELKVLVELGVDYAQGYFIQRPAETIAPIDENLVAAIKSIHTELKKKTQMTSFYPPIKYLCNVGKAVPYDQPMIDVYEWLTANPQINKICLTKGHIPVGIVDKEQLVAKMAHKDFYQNKPIHLLANSKMILVDKEMRLNEVLALAADLEKETLIIVTDQGNYFGKISLKKLQKKYKKIESKRAKGNKIH